MEGEDAHRAEEAGADDEGVQRELGRGGGESAWRTILVGVCANRVFQLQRWLRRQEALRADCAHVRREDEQRPQRLLQPAQLHVGVGEGGELAKQPHHLHVAQDERRRRDPLAVVREAVDGGHV